MAKKQETKIKMEKTPEVIETSHVIEQPKQKRKEPSYKKAEDGWEIKNKGTGKLIPVSLKYKCLLH